MKSKHLLLVSLFLSLSWLSVKSQNDFYSSFADSTLTLENEDILYDPSYFSLDYPNGDVPAGKGVCTDVVIRAYRLFGIDLQLLVHEDMKSNFSVYPQIWGMNSTDRNIDHRRVPNLMTFFERNGVKLEITNDPKDYNPGEIVCWRLEGGMTHIGIIVNRKSNDGQRHLILHNIGGGQVVEDCLFRFEIIGHYRFKG
ncbi:DUF1287 domain-containing protein [Halocola ammonii]